MSENNFVIVTGQSGAGKSQVIKFFEDIGYFCVDNLPLQLITKFAQMFKQPGSQINRVALVIDIREGTIFEQMPNLLRELKELEIEPVIVFLEANEDVLLRRFSETRRSHPWSAKRISIIENIRDECKQLQEIRGMASLIINTSGMSIKSLRERIQQTFVQGETKKIMNVVVTAFGFKYGLPMDADLVFDLRFLPNPFYIEKLRPLTGLDEPVKDFVLKLPQTRAFLDHLFPLLDFLIPNYLEEQKHYLNIAVGCTGGKHRSVAIASETAKHLKNDNLDVRLNFRDLGKE